MMQQKMSLTSHQHSAFIEITADVQKTLQNSGVTDGLCTVFVPHTTAAVTCNEQADPDVCSDMLGYLQDQVPWQRNYRHREGNSATHIKTSLLGNHVSIPVVKGQLQLGTWQGIFFAEFDGPRRREYHINICSG